MEAPALWSVFHLAEELEHRTDVTRLSRSDLANLSGDLRRAYAALAVEWLGHLSHLKESYPYLFSLALRRNPLDPSARVEIPGWHSLTKRRRAGRIAGVTPTIATWEVS